MHKQTENLLGSHQAVCRRLYADRTTERKDLLKRSKGLTIEKTSEGEVKRQEQQRDLK